MIARGSRNHNVIQNKCLNLQKKKEEGVRSLPLCQSSHPISTGHRRVCNEMCTRLVSSHGE